MNQHLSTNAAERMSPSSPQTPSECAPLHDNHRGGGSYHFPQGQLSDPPADRHSQQPAFSSISSGAPEGVEEATDDAIRGPRVFSLDKPDAAEMRNRTQTLAGKRYREKHKAERGAYMKHYRETHKAESAAYRQEHKTQIAASMKRYYEQYRAECLARAKQYYQENKAERLACAHQYQRENKAKIATQKKRYREEHKTELAARLKRYRQTPNGKAVSTAHHRNRRALKKANGEKITTPQWEIILKTHKSRCYWCGKKTDKTTMDHVIPLAKGGKHVPENIVPACLSCNLQKGIDLHTLV